jgi:hypothetical protein
VWRPEISDDPLAPLDQKRTTQDAQKQKRDEEKNHLRSRWIPKGNKNEMDFHAQ